MLEERLEKHDDRYGLLLVDIVALEDALKRLGEGETVDPVPSENALQIMRLAWTYRVAPERLQPNERRAAVVWRNFFEVCSTTPMRYVLDSSKIGTMLTGEEGSAPYRTTIRRVTELIATLGKEYVDLEQVDGKNTLVIDHDSFDPYIEELSTEAPA